MIKLSKINKSYSIKPALVDVSCTFKAGDISSVLGINGAGKTTLFRLITGNSLLDQGEIKIGPDEHSPGTAEANRLIGFVPDKYCQREKLTTVEHLQLIAGLYGKSFKVSKGISDELLERFELAEQKCKLVGELSHGMRQRLSMACALVHSPKILIFDEPLVGLDAYGADLIVSQIKEEAQKGVAIVFSSHLLSIVEKLATRIVILHQGRICKDFLAQDLAGSEGSLECVFKEATA